VRSTARVVPDEVEAEVGDEADRQRVEDGSDARRWCNGDQVRSTTDRTSTTTSPTTLPCGARRLVQHVPGSDAEPGAPRRPRSRAETNRRARGAGAGGGARPRSGTTTPARSGASSSGFVVVTRRGVVDDSRSRKSSASHCRREDRRGAGRGNRRTTPRAPPAPCGARAMTSTRSARRSAGNGDDVRASAPRQSTEVPSPTCCRRDARRARHLHVERVVEVGDGGSLKREVPVLAGSPRTSGRAGKARNSVLA